MTKEITRIPPLPAAKLVAALYLVLGLILAPLFALPALFAGEGQQSFGLGFAIAFPLIYAVGGFVGTLLFCWLYNLIAARVGGIQLSLGEADRAEPAPGV